MDWTPVTFIADEISTQGSRPIELYTVTANAEVVRFTHHKGGYTYLGDVYSQVVVSRRGIGREAGPGNVASLEVQLERGILDDYIFGVPPELFTLEIRRVQPTGTHLIWSGNIGNGALQQDGTILLRSPAITDTQLKRLVPNHIATPLCPHELYGDFCRATRASYDTATTVTSVDGVNLEVAAVGGSSGYHDTGEITFGTQRRMIVSQVGLVLEIDYPFDGLVATNAVTLYAGCLRTYEVCGTKFSNTVNFGGAPFVPLKDIYRVRLRGMGT